MKQELLTKLNPIVEEFVDKLLKQFEDLPNLRKAIIEDKRRISDIADELEERLKKAKENEVIRAKEINEKISEHEKSKMIYEERLRSANDLMTSLDLKQRAVNNKQIDLDNKLLRVNTELEQIKADGEAASREKVKYAKLSSLLQEQQKKIDNDDSKNKKKAEELEIRKINLDKRENNLNQRELVAGQKEIELEAKSENLRKLNEYLNNRKIVEGKK